MDAKDLKVFETVARCQGINRAAAELHTVQSNVTGRVRQLEAELGVALFERHPGGMKLTPAGERLMPYAQQVRAAINNAKRAISDADAPCGPLAVGIRRSTSALHLTGMLSSYLAAYPDVNVQVRTETSSVLTDLVLEHRLEGAFVCNPIEHRDLVGETVFDEELVILTAADVTDLYALRPDTRMIVLGQGSMYQRRLETVLKRGGVEIRNVLELGTLENIMSCVGAGLGVTLLPRGIVKALSNRYVRAHKIQGEDCRVQTVFIRRRDGFVSSALSAFLANARAYAKGPEVVELSHVPRLSPAQVGQVAAAG
jgi:DNA-binding transcriptional LysR family regulator